MPPRGKDADFGKWIETPPRKPKPTVAKAQDGAAIKVYKMEDPQKPAIDDVTPLKFHKIELQSPILVKKLKDIFRAENVFLQEMEVAQFTTPFKPLYFCYEQILVHHGKAKEGTLLGKHLALLMQLLDDIFEDVIPRAQNLRAAGLISYDLAWTYFPRGSTVFCGHQDAARSLRVIDTEHLADQMTIQCEEIAFDGEGFVWRPVSVTVAAFDGNLPLTSLTNYPLEFHPDQSGIRDRLAERAKKVLEYQELKYCEYEGLARSRHVFGTEKYNVNGRILIDHFGYQKHHQGLQRNEILRSVRVLPTDVQLHVTSNYVTVLAKDKQDENKKKMLAKPEDLIFVSPMLEGFALRNKLWLSFFVDDIKPVVWNDEAWGHLLYDEQQKDLVHTFVESHRHMKAGIDDVITGKGLGLILLLSGPPGTGETLTAEAVADKSRRPLYYLQAEELGIGAATLGKNIKKVFEMATEWDAVILLNEADVFMAKRSPNDIARNELVSIFLRELEYFQGIIFLTTNLYSSIEVAFRSRVNIHLLFETLSPSARLQLWQKFLARIPKEEMKKKLPAEELVELAKWELNGREIKNSIKTVRNWCVIKGKEIGLASLEAGIKSTAPQAKKIDEDDSPRKRQRIS